MTTLRESPVSKLGAKLQSYRTDRPDEWTMDEFTREAEAMAMRIKELEAELAEETDFLQTASHDLDCAQQKIKELEKLGSDMADELEANYSNQRTRIMFMKWNKTLSE